MAGTQEMLAERYGRRPADPARTRQQLKWLLIVFLIVSISFIGWAALQQSPKQVSWSDLASDQSTMTDTTATATFRVILPPGASAICTVRAVNSGLVEVGRVDITVPPEQAGRIQDVTLRTTQRATGAAIKSCVVE